jgi:uncharacterized protein involved in response to NO
VIPLTDGGFLFLRTGGRMSVVGGTALALASLWWVLRLLARSGAVEPFAAAVPDPWAHAWLMTFGALPAFAFGYLFTALPRWTKAAAVGPAVYRPVAAAYVLALLLAFAGLHLGVGVFALGAGALAATWAVGWLALLQVLLRGEELSAHATVVALALGIGLVAAAACARGFQTLDGTLVHTALRAGLQACWLPLAYAVCHRTLPWFSAVEGPRLRRPVALLVAFTIAAYAYQVLATYGRFAWLWAPSALMAVVATVELARRRPFAGARAPLQSALQLAFAWLPLALWMQTAQTAGFALTTQWYLGRAPLHALAIGFFASLALLMATVVGRDRTGPARATDAYALRCFALVQLAALLRVISELVPVGGAAVSRLLVASALAFLAGVGVWLLRCARACLRPSCDDEPA